MSLLQERSNYKPFSYEWAFNAYKLQNEIHWIANNVPLHEDVNDWKNKLSDEERNLLTQIFRFFVQADVDIAGGYINHFLPVFKAPEVRMMLSSFAGMEAVHIHAYDLLISTVGMPDSEYLAFMQYKEMADKHNYMHYLEEDDWDFFKVLAKKLAIFSAFGEGIQLFSSFAILMNFPRDNKMKGMGQIITYSIRDESHHVENMTKLFRTFISEHPDIWNDDFRGELYQACRDMVELEDRFIDLAFEQGGIEGLTAGEVRQYIRFIADRRLLQLGLKANYGVEENPLDWLDNLLLAPEHGNFFETKATEYVKGGVEGWHNVFGL